MTVALVDNGSLEPAAHQNLRAVAARIGESAGIVVHPVSWRHSDRIPSEALGGVEGAVLASWLRDSVARGERDFVFVPFFISPQGAIGSTLLAELAELKGQLGGFEFSITPGLATADAIVTIVVARVRETIAANGLARPVVIVVDHGGPSTASASLRDQIAENVRASLAPSIESLSAASLEGEEFPHNRPLLADRLEQAAREGGDVVIAPLFLSPGRHAGKNGDVTRIARAAEARSRAGLRCHITGLVGTHPAAADALASGVLETLRVRQLEARN